MCTGATKDTIEEIIAIRDNLIEAVLRFNKRVSKSELVYAVRGEHAVYAFSSSSGLKTNTLDDVQACLAEKIGRKVYCDPDYVAGIAGVFRVKLTGDVPSV